MTVSSPCWKMTAFGVLSSLSFDGRFSSTWAKIDADGSSNATASVKILKLSYYFLSLAGGLHGAASMEVELRVAFSIRSTAARHLVLTDTPS